MTSEFVRILFQMNCFVLQALGKSFTQVSDNNTMHNVQKWCQQDCYTYFIGIANQSESCDLVQRPALGGICTQVERYEKYDIRIEELGDDR
jgi:hypothetical protein